MLSELKTKRPVAYLVLFVFMVMSGCADIRLKPKDPELIKFGQFADQVTEHLLNINPTTYQKYQAILIDELSPGAIAQAQGYKLCAKSAEEAANFAKTVEKDGQRCVVQVESTSFPGKATREGLIPIEVQGSCIKSQNYLSKASKFDVLYFIGTNTKTKKPIVAAVQIKQF